MKSIASLASNRIIISTLLISLCSAAPKPDHSNAELDSLYGEIWSKPETTTIDFEALIQEIYSSQTTTTTTVDYEKLIGDIWTTQPTANKKECECVPHYQCKADHTINKHGENLLDPRSPSYCEDSLLKCCSLSDKIPVENTTIPTPKPPTEQKLCGHRNSKGIGRRILSSDNDVAEFGEFPWTVAVLEKAIVKNVPSSVFQCGGALIHPQIVLTAAHCIEAFKAKPSMLKIRAGEWDTQTKHEILPHQEREVEHVVTHIGYSKGTLHNDFGMLILSEPVDLSAENVGIVCLPEPYENFDYARCYASGWGKNDFGKIGRYSVILKRVDLPVVPNKDCQSALRTTRLGHHFELHDTFMCAGGQAGKDTCRGDGGSPLVCPMKNNPNKYAQAGIVAWGIGCGDNQLPGVYANVAYGRNWINEQAQIAGINLDEYQSN